MPAPMGAPGMGMQPGMGMLPTPIPPPPIRLFDVKIKRCIESGRIKCKSIPPEDFLIDPMATAVNEEEGSFFADITRMLRSDAKLKWPDKSDLIDQLPAYTTAVDEGAEKQARDGRFWAFRESNPDKESQEIEIVECCIKCDYDGDGVSEWRKICIGGNLLGVSGNERGILSNEEWSGPLPYGSLTVNPMPHRYRGRSLYDDVGPVQRVKTVLLRQMLDNLYLANNPQMGANQSGIINPDQLLQPEVGGTVWTNGPPAEQLAPYAVPFVAEKVFPALEYWDMVMEKRTGVSRSTMALDLDTLQHQTATAVNAQQSAAFTKVETYARNLAEHGGLRELFQKFLALFVENQKSTKKIRLRDQWVDMDPRGWNADMRATINIGLGAGSRDRDLATLGGVAQKMEQAIQALNDPFNPIINIGQLFDVYRRMVETAGIKNPQRWFPDLSQQQVQQMAQLKSQSQQPNPDQIKVQADMAKIKADSEMKVLEFQANDKRDANRAALDQAQAQQKSIIEKLQAEADIATSNAKLQAEQANEVARQNMEAARQQREFEFNREMELMKFRLEAASARSQLLADILCGKCGGTKDAMGNVQPPDPEKVQQILAQFDDMLGQQPDTPIGQAVMGRAQQGENQRDMAHHQSMAAMTQALQQLAQSMSAPTEVIRDQNNRVVGARKRLQ